MRNRHSSLVSYFSKQLVHRKSLPLSPWQPSYFQKFWWWISLESFFEIHLMQHKLDHPSCIYWFHQRTLMDLWNMTSFYKKTMLSLLQYIYLGVYQSCLLKFSTILSRTKVRLVGLSFLSDPFKNERKILLVALYFLPSILHNHCRVHFSSLEMLSTEFWLLL